MTVGDIREELEKQPFIIKGPDGRFRTWSPAWKSWEWFELPKDLKKVFKVFSKKENFIDVIYEMILDSDDRETVDFFINKVLTFEANSNLGSLYNEKETLHFASEDTVDGFWVKTPLRIVGKESIIYYGSEEDKKRKLISTSNLNKWLKFHPCQRVYMDAFNEYLAAEFDKEEKEIFRKIETIKLYDKEKQ